jgi:hypothetical protein
MNTKRTLKLLAGALLSGGIVVAGLGLATGTANAFNPQPDPPGRHISIFQRGPITAFNPQPDPPGRHLPHLPSILRH